MKKTNKALVSLLALPLLLSGLAGCNTNTTPTTPGGESSTTDTPTDTVKIKFWHTFGQTIVDALNAKINNFKTLVKTNDGVDVEIALEYQGSYDDIKDKISKGFAVDNTPTIAVAYPDHVADYLEHGKAANKEYVVNLDEFINDEEIGFGAEDWLGDEYGEEDFIEDFYDEGQKYINEGTYSLPYMKSTEIMFYNMDLLVRAMNIYKPEFESDKALIEDYMADISWDEFLDLCALIKANKATISNDIEVPGYYDSDANFFITKMYQEEIPFASIDSQGKGSIDFENEPAFTQTVDLLKGIRSAHKDGLITTKGIINKYGSDYFTNQKTVFSIGSSGGAGYNIPQSDAFEVGVCRVPASNDNAIYVTQGPTLTMFNNLAISEEQNSLVKTYAWKFLKYITNGEVNAELCLNGSEGYVPVRYSAYETDFFLTFMEEAVEYGHPYAKCYSTVINDINNVGGYLVTPAFKGSAALREYGGSMLTAVLNSTSEDEIPGLVRACINNTKLKM